MTKKNTNIDDFDFGFCSVSEIEVKGIDKTQKMYDMILPLLQNLKKDADKNEYIFWPNREAKINEFISKLTEVLNGV